MKIEEIKSKLESFNIEDTDAKFTVSEIIKVFEIFNEFQLNKILNIHHWNSSSKGYDYIEIFVKGRSFLLILNKYVLITKINDKEKVISISELRLLLKMYFRFGILEID